MKLLTFIKEQEYRLGIQTRQGILDVAATAAQLYLRDLPSTMQEVIDQGEPGLAALRKLALKASSVVGFPRSVWLEEEALKFAPCVPSSNKIICVGLNYRRHAEETHSPIPQYPILFSKFNNALSAHGDEIELPAASRQVDYECELAIIIGKKTRHVTKEQAFNQVFGYCIANDLSARDLQMQSSQWLLGKTCDGFSPLGPYLVTADEVGNPNDLWMKTTVNGEMRQHSRTSDMIFACEEIISYISRHFTLMPGDVILTGTPEGVVMGLPPEDQVYLQPGDVVTVEIEKLGSMTNRMVAETTL